MTNFGVSKKLAERTLAGHTTSPTTVDWDGDGKATSSSAPKTAASAA